MPSHIGAAHHNISSCVIHIGKKARGAIGFQQAQNTDIILSQPVDSPGEETYNEFSFGIQFQYAGMSPHDMCNLLADMLKMTPPVSRSIQ